jgi:hypothetical protein
LPLAGTTELLADAVTKQKQRAEQTEEKEREESAELRTMFATWYPTLERTLLGLSKLYLSVDVLPFVSLYLSICGSSRERL